MTASLRYTFSGYKLHRVSGSPHESIVFYVQEDPHRQIILMVGTPTPWARERRLRAIVFDVVFEVATPFYDDIGNTVRQVVMKKSKKTLVKQKDEYLFQLKLCLKFKLKCSWYYVRVSKKMFPLTRYKPDRVGRSCYPNVHQ